jgi:hypothetical protein
MGAHILHATMLTLMFSARTATLCRQCWGSLLTSMLLADCCAHAFNVKTFLWPPLAAAVAAAVCVVYAAPRPSAPVRCAPGPIAGHA